jgi:hypothetical protein
MEHLFREFDRKHKAGARTVFDKSLEFYVESLKEFKFNDILTAMQIEIDTLKKKREEMIKTEMDMIKNIA